jgi:hypothetical protein
LSDYSRPPSILSQGAVDGAGIEFAQCRVGESLRSGPFTVGLGASAA